MLRSLCGFAVVSALVFTAGCSNGVTTSGSGENRIIEGDVGGSWRSSAGATGQIAIDVTVSTSDVTGIVKWHTNTRCPMASFAGTYDEVAKTMVGEFSGPTGKMMWSATLRGDVLSGPYSYLSGQCSGEKGSISLTRS